MGSTIVLVFALILIKIQFLKAQTINGSQLVVVEKVRAAVFQDNGPTDFDRASFTIAFVMLPHVIRSSLSKSVYSFCTCLLQRSTC